MSLLPSTATDQKGLGKMPQSTVNYERTIRAVALQGEGRVREAEKLLVEQIAEYHEDALALYSLAVIEHNRGSSNAALVRLEQALHLWPGFGQALAAHDAVREAIARKGASPSAIHANPSVIAQQISSTATPGPGNHQEASDARVLQALSLHHAGRIEEAKYAFEGLLVDYPGSFVASYSLALLAHQQQQPFKALDFADRALAVADTTDNQSLVQFMRGTILMGLGLFDDALQAFDHAIELKPNNSQASNNKASILQLLRRETEAVQCLAQAHTNDPADPLILNNLGIALTIFKQNAAAVPYFDRLLAIDPHYDLAEGYRFFAKLHACDWSNYEEHRASIDAGIRAGRMVVNPLAFMAMSDNSADHLRCSRLFAERRVPQGATPLWKGERYRHRRLRIGYLSPDFREHAVGALLAGVIEQHDPAVVETFAFSIGANDHSSFRRRYKLAFEHFLDCKEKLSAEIATLIRAAEIDVLVDLAGYTAGSKTDILAMRPAPAQVNYLGFAGTMGADCVDYIISDAVVIPEDAEGFYAEKVIRLPHSYLPIDDSVLPQADPGPRSQHGLPDKGLVFCSFNHDYKINPPVWRVWMELLRDFPGSVLWLAKLNQDSEANLRRECAAQGVDPSRLIFAERVPDLGTHLARYHHVDVYLDTFPYNAHSTATDLVRMGVPIVTAAGRSFASRVAAGVVASYAPSGLSSVGSSVGLAKADQLAVELRDPPAGVVAALASGGPTAKTPSEDSSREAYLLSRYREDARTLAREVAASGPRQRLQPSVQGLTARHARSLEHVYREIVRGP